MDFMQVRAWMAEHVLLTTVTAVALTAVVLLLAKDFAGKSYMRLYQISAIAGLAVGALAIYLWMNNGAHSLLLVGVSVLVSTCVGTFSGWRVHRDLCLQIKTLKDKHIDKDKLPGFRVVVDPHHPGESKKT